MKLDKNINKDGGGKYALLKLRKLLEIQQLGTDHSVRIQQAVELLNSYKLLHCGDEGPGEQFFVMKYKDKFTAPALRAYAIAVEHSAQADSTPEQIEGLVEYAAEIRRETHLAFEQGNRMPD